MQAWVKAAGNTSKQAAARYIGTATILIGAAVLVPLTVIPWSPGDTRYAPCFIFPGLVTMAAGYLLRFMLGGSQLPRKSLERGEACACTVLVWLIAIAAFATPLVLSGQLDVVQAIFEATSGLTTTGLTVSNPDICPRIILMHRSFMQYMGGVGLVLVLTCVVGHYGNLKVYNVEGHTDRLLPSTKKTARAILTIYTLIILLGAAAYKVAGMGFFDAVTTSMAAVSTGGFCTHSESIAYFHSLSIEVITIVLMLLGATNFLLLFMLLRGKVRNFLSHVETRVFFGTIALATLAVALLLFTKDHGPDLGTSFRRGFGGFCG